MSQQVDTDRVIAAWLAQGPEVLADRVLGSVSDRVRRTPQQRQRRLAWGDPAGRIFVRMAAVVVVLVVVASGALLFSRLVPQQGGLGPSAPTVPSAGLPSPAASPTSGRSTPTASTTTSAPVPSTTAPSPSTAVSPTPDPTTSEFTGRGLRFRFPSSWAQFEINVFHTMGSVISVLGASRIGDACPAPIDVNCVYGYRLAPGETRLVVGTGARPGGDFLRDRPVDGRRFTVDGLPGYVTTTETCYGATECRYATLAMPGSVDNWYELQFELAGPGLEDGRAAFEKLLAGMHYELPVDRLPSDPDAPAAVLRQVLTENATYGYSIPEYSCFPTEPGATRKSTIAISGGSPATPTSHRFDVSCTSDIEATELELWRVTLTTSWDAGPGRQAGSHIETNWVKPNGERAGTMQSGDDFPLP